MGQTNESTARRHYDSHSHAQEVELTDQTLSVTNGKTTIGCGEVTPLSLGRPAEEPPCLHRGGTE